MFTGIIEALGEVKAIQKEGLNVHYTLTCPFVEELKVDQSVSHNGVCLTVVDIQDNTYTVTAIEETLLRTQLDDWEVGGFVNLERCMLVNSRFDGHIVQGHIDTTAICENIFDKEGSSVFVFRYDYPGVTVEKGSITVNGTSLTVVLSEHQCFSVHIIPFTLEHTVFGKLEVGHRVNIEFDIVGKYVDRLLQQKK